MFHHSKPAEVVVRRNQQNERNNGEPFPYYLKRGRMVALDLIILEYRFPYEILHEESLTLFHCFSHLLK